MRKWHMYARREKGEETIETNQRPPQLAASFIQAGSVLIKSLPELALEYNARAAAIDGLSLGKDREDDE